MLSLACKDIGFYFCDYVLRADFEDQLEKKVVKHCLNHHNLKPIDITKAFKSKIQLAMHEEIEFSA